MPAFSLRRRVPRASILWALTSLGCAVLAFIVVRDLADRAARPGDRAATVPVVVAAGDLAPGHELTAEDLEMAELPSPAPPAGIVDVAEALGRVTVTPFLAGEPITVTRLAEDGGALVASVPPGALGVVLRVDALPDGLAPGDRVDVLATFTAARPYTTTVAEDVTVLQVPAPGQGPLGTGSGGTQVVVVASPEVARQLVQASATGTVAIAVRGYEPASAPWPDGG